MKRTNKIITVLLFLFLSLSCIAKVYAHPGRTDANGGHTDRSDGSYHYHHGYSAHAHTNGVCPYDYDDKTQHKSSLNDYDYSENNKKDNLIIYNKPNTESPSVSENESDSDANNQENDIDFETKNEQVDEVTSLWTKEEILGLVTCALALVIIFIITNIILYFVDKKEWVIPKYKPITIGSDITSQIYDLRIKTSEFLIQLQKDLELFDIDNTLKNQVKIEIVNKKYKSAIYLLLEVGIYRDYFYDMLDLEISQEELKEYADYRAFITME